MLGQPHPARSEGGPRQRRGVSLGLGDARGLLKQRPGLGQPAACEDGLGALDHQLGRRTGQGGGGMDLDRPLQERGRGFEAVDTE